MLFLDEIKIELNWIENYYNMRNRISILAEDSIFVVNRYVI